MNRLLFLLAFTVVCGCARAYLPPAADFDELSSKADAVVVGALEGDATSAATAGRTTILLDAILSDASGQLQSHPQVAINLDPAGVDPRSIRAKVRGLWFLKATSGGGWRALGGMLPTLVVVSDPTGAGMGRSPLQALAQRLSDTIAADDSALNAAEGLAGEAQHASAEDTREQALAALCQLPRLEALPRLDALFALRRHEVQLLAAAGRAHYGVFDGLEKFRNDLSHPREPDVSAVRTLASTLMDVRENPGAKPAALMMIQSTDDTVREAGIQILRKSASIADVAVLLPLLNDGNARFRYMAADTFARLAGEPRMTESRFLTQEATQLPHWKDWAARQAATR